MPEMGLDSVLVPDTRIRYYVPFLTAKNIKISLLGYEVSLV